MEHELAEIRSDDSHSKDQVRSGYVRDFRTMRDWKETGASLQYDLLVDIGKKLLEYSKSPRYVTIFAGLTSANRHSPGSSA